MPSSEKLFRLYTFGRMRLVLTVIFLFGVGLGGEVLAEQNSAAQHVHAEGIFQVVLVVAASLSLGFLAYFLLLKALGRWAARTSPDFKKAVNRYFRLPLLALLPLVALIFSSSFVSLSLDFAVSVKRTLSLLLIAVVTWLFISSIRVIEYVILSRYDVRAKDNLKARAVYTQIVIAQ